MRGLIALSLYLLVALASASPMLEVRNARKPKCYYGTDFPAKKTWLKGQELWDHNLPTLLGHNTQAEVDQIYHAIINMSHEAGLDRRVVFAVMMRESTGDAHVIAGDGGRSAGLMQIHSGESCYGTERGGCSAHHIRRMIRHGIFGTEFSEGLKSCYETWGNYPAALRCYNSGSVLNPDDLSIGLGTPSYVSDVGNILQGLEYPTNCFE